MNQREKWGLFITIAGFTLLVGTHITNVIAIVNGLEATMSLWFPIVVTFGGGLLFFCGGKE